VRCRTDSTPDPLGNIVLAISGAGGNIGEVHVIQDGHRFTIRDITIYADNEHQLALSNPNPEAEFIPYVSD